MNLCKSNISLVYFGILILLRFTSYRLQKQLFVDPHKNCSTLNWLVAKMTVGISRGYNCSAKIFIVCDLEFKLNFANTQGRIEICLNVTVNN